MDIPNTPKASIDGYSHRRVGFGHHHDDSSQQPRHFSNAIVELISTETVIVAANSQSGSQAGTDRDRDDDGGSDDTAQGCVRCFFFFIIICLLTTRRTLPVPRPRGLFDRPWGSRQLAAVVGIDFPHSPRRTRSSAPAVSRSPRWTGGLAGQRSRIELHSKLLDWPRRRR